MPVKELLGGAGDLGWVAAKAAIMFGFVAVALRVAERRTIAQLSAFDFAVAVAVGAIVGRTVTSSTTSALTGVTALATLLVAHRAIVELRRVPVLEGLLEQQPRLLVVDGELRQRALRRSGLSPGDVAALLREHGCGRIEEVRFLVWETRGVATVVRRDDEVGPLVQEALARASGAHRGGGAA